MYKQLQCRIRPARLTAMAVLLLVFLTADVYRSYFIVWARNPNVPYSFSHHAVELGRELNSLPPEIPKYVVVADVDSAGVHMMQMDGAPVFALGIMFGGGYGFSPHNKRPRTFITCCLPRRARYRLVQSNSI